MPMYDYKCTGSKPHEFEQELSFDQVKKEVVVTCYRCGAVARRIIKSAPPVQYKGDWPVHENRGF